MVSSKGMVGGVCCCLILSCGEILDQRGPQTNKPNNSKPSQIDAYWSLYENQTTKTILCKCGRMLMQGVAQTKRKFGNS